MKFFVVIGSFIFIILLFLYSTTKIEINTYDYIRINKMLENDPGMIDIIRAKSSDNKISLSELTEIEDVYYERNKSKFLKKINKD